MTTLVFRDGVMAADSRITVGETVISDNAVKVHKLSDGSLLGWAGRAEHGAILLDALQSDEDQQIDGPLDLLALWVVKGKVFLFEGSAFVQQRDKYYAVGSGTPYALGAMDAGADAITACKIGTKRDIGSGGRVRSISVGDK